MHKKIKNKILIFFFSMICILAVYILGFYRGMLDGDVLSSVSNGALSASILEGYERYKKVDRVISGYDSKVSIGILASSQFKEYSDIITSTIFNDRYVMKNEQVLVLANYKGINNFILKCDDLDEEPDEGFMSRDNCHDLNDYIYKLIKENPKK